MRKVLIVRNFAKRPDPESYNLQEVGLGKAFVRKGFNCDIIFYTDQASEDEVIYSYNGKKLTVKWQKAIKFMSNSIFLKILNASFLNKYEYIITFEYNQIMTFLLSFFKKSKVILYHGPYKDNNNKIVQSLYDLFFTKLINKNVFKTYTKSDLAKNYLLTKGFNNVITVGVGLDIEKIDNPTTTLSEEVKYLLKKVEGRKVILYTGLLAETRNINFLLKTFQKVLQINNDSILVLIGNGNNSDIESYLELAKKIGIFNNLIHLKRVKQIELKEIYKRANVFIFPSAYDIFGMVLLESMYFGLPIISSINGGAVTLINRNKNGIIIDELDIEKWKNKIDMVLNNKSLSENLSKNAKITIRNNYTWDSILEKMIKD